MSWVKIDDGAPDHPKQLKAGAEACWLWVCGLAYCNRQTKRRDGFIPEEKVPALYPVRGATRLAEKLVEVGLWERVTGGYLVHDYLEFQPTADLRSARAEAGRRGGVRSGEARRTKTEPSAKQVASNTEAHALNPVPVPVPVPLDSNESNQAAPVGVTPIRSGASLVAVTEEYDAAARAVLGTFALGRFADRDLIGAVNGHAPPGLPGAELRKRVRASVTAYIESTRTQDPKFNGGWQPKGWLTWLNSPPNGETLSGPRANALAPPRVRPITKATVSPEQAAKDFAAYEAAMAGIKGDARA
jgi:hypothetical protein